MKKKHPMHHTAHIAWRYAMKRKLLAGLSAGLLAVAGLAAGDAYVGVKHWIALHEANAAAVPGLVKDAATMRAEIDDLKSLTNADCWRWRRQERINTNHEARIRTLE